MLHDIIGEQHETSHTALIRIEDVNPMEDPDRLREVAQWMFINGECIYGVRPWIITNEADVWFTKAKGADTLYAIVKSKEPWKFGGCHGGKSDRIVE